MYYTLSLKLNERIAERRQNLVSDKHSKTGLVLHMPTVHPVLLQMARTELLDARDASINLPLVLVPWIELIDRSSEKYIT